MSTIAQINRALFMEDRIINRFDRAHLLMLLAYVGSEPVGFKVGYGLANKVYYSAKGGVTEGFRRRGIARSLLFDMMDRATRLGYRSFVFDTFPAMHAGMTVLAIEEGFVLTSVEYTERYANYRLRFTQDLGALERGSEQGVNERRQS
jgi:predicted GNAT superfamily acetyltransferase